MTNHFVFEADLAAKQIHMTREFNAPIEKVWQAFTDPDLLMKWIAPQPWTAEAKTWDFTVGGVSLYAMVSTEGQKHWVYAEFTAIEHGRKLSTRGMFCDSDGKPLVEGPKSYRDTQFLPIEGNRTRVETVISFEDESTIKWFVEGGFKAGSEATFASLDKLLDMQ